jgi:hypothetical protein
MEARSWFDGHMRKIAAPSLALAALMTGAVEAPSASAASWGPPVAISRPAGAILAPRFVFDTHGRALAVWHSSPFEARNALRAASRPRGGDWSPERAITTFVQAPLSVSVLRADPPPRRRAPGREGAVLLGLSSRRLSPPRVTALFGRDTTGTRFVTFQRLDPGHYAQPRHVPALAVNRRGYGVAAWERAEGKRSSVVVSLRRPDHAFGRARRISRRGLIDNLTTAVDARGDVIVAWRERDRGVQVRIRRAGHRFGRTIRPGRTDSSAVLASALSRRGHVIVVWATQQTNEGEAEGLARVEAVVGSVRRGLGARQRLETFAEGRKLSAFGSKPGAAFTARGEGLVAWKGDDGSHARVRSAVLAGGRFTRPQALSAPGEAGVLQDLETGASGQAAVLWARVPDPGGPAQLVSSYRPSRADFGPVETVAPPDPELLLVDRSPSLAFDPVTGQPAAIWIREDGGGAQRVEVATRR